MKVPLLDLRPPLEELRDEIVEAVTQVIDSTRYIMGPEIDGLESEISAYCGTTDAVGVSSGTDALLLSLMVLDVAPGDLVLTSNFSFFATAGVVARLNATPVFVDIDLETFNIDPESLRKTLTDMDAETRKRVKAIIPVHFGGHSCEMDEIIRIAKQYNLKIIEDAAHALPSFYKNKKIGTFSDAVCFSFYATKTLSTGEGGMVTTNNKKIAKKVSLQRLHGINGDAWKRYEQDNDWYYEVIDLGYKYNTTDIQSAIGLVQLEKLEWMRDERKMIAEKYKNAFSGKLDFIEENIKNESSWHLFVIKIGNRDELHQKLKEKGISTSVHFIPIHKHPYYKKIFSLTNEDYPVANLVFEQSLSLPIYPGLGESEVEYIIKYVLEYAEDIN